MFRAAIGGVGTWGRTRVDSVQGKSDIIPFTDHSAETGSARFQLATLFGLLSLRSGTNFMIDFVPTLLACTVTTVRIIVKPR